MYLHDLKKQYALKQISEEEYRKQEDRYISRLVNLYCRDMITKERLYEMMTE